LRVISVNPVQRLSLESSTMEDDPTEGEVRMSNSAFWLVTQYSKTCWEYFKVAEFKRLLLSTMCLWNYALRHVSIAP
jgi:hypothetical protein